MKKIVCIGGLNLDILGTTNERLVYKDSNIGNVILKRGGVASNIASIIANEKNIESYVISSLSNDIFAEFLKQEAEKQGINCSLLIKTKEKSPIYLAIHDETGEMQLAINDTEAVNALKADEILEKYNKIKDFSCVVLDSNLNEDCLVELSKSIDIPIVADPVSTRKASRLKAIFNRIYAFKPNLSEALELTGKSCVEDAAKCLVDFGIKQVYISLGSEGVYYSDSQSKGKIKAERLRLKHVTGAGDSFVAGIAIGIARGLSIEETALLGTKKASEHLMKTNED